MPLLKLWNSLRGRSATSEEKSTESNPTPPSPKKRSLLGLGRGPHAALCKQVRNLDVDSVLEISVGDGTRAIALMKALASKNDQVRYVAIDEFESGEGTTSLKTFHHSLRCQNIPAQLFPGQIASGLHRVATTIGAVDLVLIAAESERWNDPVVLSMLRRVVHSESTVLYLDGEQWLAHRHEASVRRAA